MRNARGVLVWLPTLSFLFLATALRTSAQATSTPEERVQWVETTHKLESSPLDDSVNKQGDAALKRLSEVHDIHVPLCPALLSEFSGMKYIYSHAITRQYMLASGAFIVENPDKAADTNAMNLSAVESVLKVYSAILRQKPDTKWKTLDELLKKQSQRKLDESLQKTCGAQNRSNTGAETVDPTNGSLHLAAPVLVSAKTKQ